MVEQSPPRDGEHRVQFADGSLNGIEHFVDGEFAGEWKHYAKDGSLRKTEKHPDRS